MSDEDLRDSTRRRVDIDMLSHFEVETETVYHGKLIYMLKTVTQGSRTRKTYINVCSKSSCGITLSHTQKRICNRCACFYMVCAYCADKYTTLGMCPDCTPLCDICKRPSADKHKHCTSCNRWMNAENSHVHFSKYITQCHDCVFKFADRQRNSLIIDCLPIQDIVDIVNLYCINY